MTDETEDEGQVARLISRLENWGAALGGRMLTVKATTASLEGGYRAPRGAWYDPGAPSTQVSPDMVDATEIETAVVLTPMFHHVLLRAHYVKKLAPGTCIKRARTAGGPDSPSGEFFPRHLEQAHNFVAAYLELPAVVRRERARAYAKAIVGDTDDAWGAL